MATFEDLMSIQVGKETTWATAVTPSVKLMGVEDVGFDPVVNGVLIKDKRGSLAPGYITATTEVSAAGNVKGVATYEDLPYWLEALFGIVAPSGAGPYVRAGAAPVTAVPVTPRWMTLMYGDAAAAYQIDGGVVTDLTISGKTKEPMRYEAKMLGKKTTSSVSLAALSDRTVVPIMGDHTAVYVDAVGGTVGSTQLTATAFEFEIAIKSNRVLRMHLGSLYPDNYNEPRFTANIKMTLEFLTASKAYLDAILGAAAVLEHQIRIKATSGTKIQQFDVAGAALSAPKMFTFKDSLAVLEIDETVEYNATLGNYIKYSNTSGVATLA